MGPRHFGQDVIMTKSRIALYAGAAFISASMCSSFADSAKQADPDGVAKDTIVVLPRDESQSLKITEIPTSQPIPLIVGNTWTCHKGAGNHEFCRLTLVVCTNDQSFCINIP